MTQTDSPVSDYLFHYRRHPKQSFASKQIYYPWESTKKTVWTTWEISYEAVRERSPLAAEVLILCGFLSPRLITAALFITQSSIGNLESFNSESIELTFVQSLRFIRLSEFSVPIHF